MTLERVGPGEAGARHDGTARHGQRAQDLPRRLHLRARRTPGSPSPATPTTSAPSRSTAPSPTSARPVSGSASPPTPSSARARAAPASTTSPFATRRERPSPNSASTRAPSRARCSGVAPSLPARGGRRRARQRPPGRGGTTMPKDKHRVSAPPRSRLQARVALPSRGGMPATRDRCEGDVMGKLLDLTPERGILDPIEIASRDEIAALQRDRLRWSLRHAYDNVAHYRRGLRRSRRAPGRLPRAVRPRQVSVHHKQHCARRPLRHVRRAAGPHRPHPRLLGHHRQADGRRLHRRATSRCGRTSWRARSAPRAGAPA
jgi:hypothetical protein